ncbi:hypothetical protein D9758_014645 [Tetrapyrgos nigripes]|uniref:Uncharacterized protein n=1 Tax=Tetrapyrgos nigripes TaxID=182062 RepID=A0A8H5FTL9_9AGAR|nr:hypothetical protein D9758_014645 [Tetrapyrgos nigripes]
MGAIHPDAGAISRISDPDPDPISFNDVTIPSPSLNPDSQQSPLSRTSAPLAKAISKHALPAKHRPQQSLNRSASTPSTPAPVVLVTPSAILAVTCVVGVVTSVSFLQSSSTPAHVVLVAPSAIPAAVTSVPFMPSPPLFLQAPLLFLQLTVIATTITICA